MTASDVGPNNMSNAWTTHSLSLSVSLTLSQSFPLKARQHSHTGTGNRLVGAGVTAVCVCDRKKGEGMEPNDAQWSNKKSPLIVAMTGNRWILKGQGPLLLTDCMWAREEPSWGAV